MFLDEYLTKTEPNYACHIHNRKEVINQLLKLNKNGIKKFIVLNKGNSSSGRYLPGVAVDPAKVLILWYSTYTV